MLSASVYKSLHKYRTGGSRIFLASLASNPKFSCIFIYDSVVFLGVFHSAFPFGAFRNGMETSKKKKTILRAIPKFPIISYQEFLLYLIFIQELPAVSDE